MRISHNPRRRFALRTDRGTWEYRPEEKPHRRREHPPQARKRSPPRRSTTARGRCAGTWEGGMPDAGRETIRGPPRPSRRHPCRRAVAVGSIRVACRRDNVASARERRRSCLSVESRPALAQGRTRSLSHSRWAEYTPFALPSASPCLIPGKTCRIPGQTTRNAAKPRQKKIQRSRPNPKFPNDFLKIHGPHRTRSE